MPGGSGRTRNGEVPRGRITPARRAWPLDPHPMPVGATAIRMTRAARSTARSARLEAVEKLSQLRGRGEGTGKGARART